MAADSPEEHLQTTQNKRAPHEFVEIKPSNVLDTLGFNETTPPANELNPLLNFIPHVRQFHNWDCGIACLRMILWLESFPVFYESYLRFQRHTHVLFNKYS